MQDTPRKDKNRPRLVAPRTSRSGPSHARPTDDATGPVQPGQRRNSKKSIFATSGADKTGPKQERPCKGREKSRLQTLTTGNEGSGLLALCNESKSPRLASAKTEGVKSIQDIPRMSRLLPKRPVPDAKKLTSSRAKSLSKVASPGCKQSKNKTVGSTLLAPCKSAENSMFARSRTRRKDSEHTTP